jgi:hypothetical protein
MNRPLLALTCLLVATACAPKKPDALGTHLVIHGVVYDAGTDEVASGVQVTLGSLDAFPSVTTSASGYFRFERVKQLDAQILQFAGAGYETVTVTIDTAKLVGSTLTATGTGGSVITNANGACLVSGAATCQLTFDPAQPDAYAVVVKMARLVSLPVAGYVYAGSRPGATATVRLLSSTDPAIVAYETTTDGSGHFLFQSVKAASYTLAVNPLDTNADGIYEFQYFLWSDLAISSQTVNLSNLVIRLLDAQKQILAGSFEVTGGAGSTAGTYPLTASTSLAATALQQDTTILSLHFGAEVNTALTQFELVAIDQNGASAVVSAPVTWTKNVIATFTPAAPLSAYPTQASGYELRITSLYWADGTAAIAPAPGVWGKITFTIQSLPQPLVSPKPDWFVAGVHSADGGRAGLNAMVTASSVRVVDAAGDLLTTWTASQGLTLQWSPVVGAARYRVHARNTSTSGGGLAPRHDWQLLGTYQPAFDPNLAGPVVVSGIGALPLISPGVAALWDPVTFGYQGMPWLFGNGVELAITALDALGFESTIDTTKLLVTREESFGGILTAAAIRAAGADPQPFTEVAERGVDLSKTFRLTFNEPMDASSTPALTSLSTRVTVNSVTASGWANGAASTIPINSGTDLYAKVALTIPGTCTEVLENRSIGDLTVRVRDNARFTTTGKALFLSGAAAPLQEATVSAAAGGLVTVSQGLRTDLVLPSVLCALSGAGAPAQTGQPTLLVTPTQPTVRVGGAAVTFRALSAGTAVSAAWSIIGGLPGDDVGTLSAATGSSVSYTPPTRAPGAAIWVVATLGSNRAVMDYVGLTVLAGALPALHIGPQAGWVEAGSGAMTLRAAQLGTPVAVTWTPLAAGQGTLGTPSGTSGEVITWSPPATAVGAVTLTATAGLNTATATFFVVASGSLTSSGAVTVESTEAFYPGQQVAYYEPVLGTAPGLLDVRTVASLDSVTGTLFFTVAPSAGHTSASLVFPLDGVTGEYVLRSPADAVLSSDVAAGSGATIYMDNATTAVVGDSVLLDADGDLVTTSDQAIAKVVSVRLSPTTALMEVVLDQIPASVGTLRHGTSVVRFLGDAFTLSGVANTAPVAVGGTARPLDRHGARFAANGAIF